MFGGKKKQRRAQVAADGTFAWGEMTALKKHRLQDHQNTHTWEVTARFETAEGQVVESMQEVEFLQWDPPAVGNAVSLRYDPSEPEFWIWEKHPPGQDAPAQIVVDVQAEPVEARLDRLEKLHEAGAIDDAEYAAQRQRIIGSL